VERSTTSGDFIMHEIADIPKTVIESAIALMDDNNNIAYITIEGDDSHYFRISLDDGIPCIERLVEKPTLEQLGLEDWA
jgi:hypothetical protein